MANLTLQTSFNFLKMFSRLLQNGQIIRNVRTYKTLEQPFRKVMAANRGEIALRIMRAAHELNAQTVGIYAYEDRFCMHRYKADESYQLNPKKSAVGAYLDIPCIY